MTVWITINWKILKEMGILGHLTCLLWKKWAGITEIFAEIPAFYVADGHHRTAAAALVGAEKNAKV